MANNDFIISILNISAFFYLLIQVKISANLHIRASLQKIFAKCCTFLFQNHFIWFSSDYYPVF